MSKKQHIAWIVIGLVSVILGTLFAMLSIEVNINYIYGAIPFSISYGYSCSQVFGGKQKND